MKKSLHNISNKIIKTLTFKNLVTISRLYFWIVILRKQHRDINILKELRNKEFRNFSIYLIRVPK